MVTIIYGDGPLTELCGWPARSTRIVRFINDNFGCLCCFGYLFISLDESIILHISLYPPPPPPPPPPFLSNMIISQWCVANAIYMWKYLQLDPRRAAFFTIITTRFGNVLYHSGTTASLWVSGNTLQWRHNGRDGVPNDQPHNCLLNRLFRLRSKQTSKLRVTGLFAGNSPVTGEFLAQKASNAEKRFHLMTSWCNQTGKGLFP